MTCVSTRGEETQTEAQRQEKATWCQRHKSQQRSETSGLRASARSQAEASRHSFLQNRRGSLALPIPWSWTSSSRSVENQAHFLALGLKQQSFRPSSVWCFVSEANPRGPPHSWNTHGPACPGLLCAQGTVGYFPSETNSFSYCFWLCSNTAPQRWLSCPSYMKQQFTPNLFPPHHPLHSFPVVSLMAAPPSGKW